jgi:hypothetical protein
MNATQASNFVNSKYTLGWKQLNNIIAVLLPVFFTWRHQIGGWQRLTSPVQESQRARPAPPCCHPWLRHALDPPRPGRLPRYVSVRDLATCRATDPRRNRRIGMESSGRISWTGKGIGKNSREGNLSLARSQIFLSILGPAFFFWKRFPSALWQSFLFPIFLSRGR